MAVDVSKIGTVHAERVLERMGTRDEQGTMVVNGEKVEWWSDGIDIWFYEPGHDGEDTIKRFTTDVVVA